MNSLETHFFRVIEKKILEDIAEIESALSTGKVANIEEYRERVGRIAGLRTTLDYMREKSKEQL